MIMDDHAQHCHLSSILQEKRPILRSPRTSLYMVSRPSFFLFLKKLIFTIVYQLLSAFWLEEDEINPKFIINKSLLSIFQIGTQKTLVDDDVDNDVDDEWGSSYGSCYIQDGPDYGSFMSAVRTP